MKKIVVLGCTGSIGTSTLNIIREFPRKFTICGLTAHRQEKKLLKLAKEFNCSNFLLTNNNKNAIKNVIENADADIVVNGIAGSAGLKPSIYTLENGIDLALANKETIVMASTIVKNLAQKNNCAILPVDSEHSALFNLIENYGTHAIDSIILTASGGPFRNWQKSKIDIATPEDALQHPTWNMGTKITIDSASLANKGLEVIEACHLFNISPEKVHVSVHPQSLVHSLIQTKDGVLYAQISRPDMRYPLLSALTWPEYCPNSFEKLDLTALMGHKTEKNPAGDGINMQFFPARINDFPMLSLAYTALNKGGASTIAYNAANEVAVAAFLQKKIQFSGISTITQKVLHEDWSTPVHTIDDVFYYDTKARKVAEKSLINIQNGEGF